MLEQIAAAVTGNGGTQKVYVLFNKATGAFFTTVSYHDDHGFDTNLFNIAVVESFDETTQSVIGNWDSWEIVNKVDQPEEVLEKHIDAVTQQAILDEFSLGKQVNTASAAIVAIAKATGTTDLPEVQALIEQLDQIELKIEAGNLRKIGYAADDSFSYVSNADLAAQEALRLGGGLFELSGPRQVV